jgi:hypothetical protein
MSSSIRPPGAPPPGPAGLDGISELKPGQPAATTGAQAAAPAQAGTVESPTGAWLRRLSAGEVSKEQAVEGLVAQALEAQGGARLSPAQRSELAEVLRDALLNDPVLGELLAG